MKLCTIEGCERKHQAKGYCGTHYNQKLQPNRHRKEAVACDWCGTTCYKEPGRRNKYKHMYCTEQCRSTHFKALARLKSGPPLNFIGYWINCMQCDTPVLTRDARQMFCTRRCARLHRNPSGMTESQIEQIGITCSTCGKEFRSKHLGQLTCSPRCNRTRSKQRYGGSGSAWISKARRLAIYERDNWTCKICNKEIDKSADPMRGDFAASLDHIIPVSRNGTHAKENLRTTHRICNSLRGDASSGALF